MKALIVVDVQNDFLPGGALAVPEGSRVIAPINSLMPEYRLVVATQDWHPADHLSFASRHPGRAPGESVTLDGLEQILWPDHCVQGTPGASFASELDVFRFSAVFRKGTRRRIDSYSGMFDNGRRHATGLADYLRSMNVHAVDICGLATDYCVKFTALDAVAEGFETALIVEAARGVNLAPGDCDAALARLGDSGVKIV